MGFVAVNNAVKIYANPPDEDFKATGEYKFFVQYSSQGSILCQLWDDEVDEVWVKVPSEFCKVEVVNN